MKVLIALVLLSCSLIDAAAVTAAGGSEAGLVSAPPSPTPGAGLLQESVRIGADTVAYTALLPDGYDPERQYPTILAFPPGSQAPDMVEFSVVNIWRDEARRRGYIVIVPAAPDGDMFFGDGARVVPGLIDHVLERYPVQGGRLHVAGPSNGGRSSLHAAAARPAAFVTVTVFPGYLPAGGGDSAPAEVDPGRMAALEGLCIRMFVGGNDQPWRDLMEPQAATMREIGLDVTLTVEADQGHLPRSLVRENAHRLFDTIEACGDAAAD